MGNASLQDESDCISAVDVEWRPAANSQLLPMVDDMTIELADPADCAAWNAQCQVSNASDCRSYQKVLSINRVQGACNTGPHGHCILISSSVASAHDCQKRAQLPAFCMTVPLTSSNMVVAVSSSECRECRVPGHAELLVRLWDSPWKPLPTLLPATSMKSPSLNISVRFSCCPTSKPSMSLSCTSTTCSVNDKGKQSLQQHTCIDC